jgi:hypothetical protein
LSPIHAKRRRPTSVHRLDSGAIHIEVLKGPRV